jgi:hypothetical protein
MQPGIYIGQPPSRPETRRFGGAGVVSKAQSRETVQSHPIKPILEARMEDSRWRMANSALKAGGVSACVRYCHVLSDKKYGFLMPRRGAIIAVGTFSDGAAFRGERYAQDARGERITSRIRSGKDTPRDLSCDLVFFMWRNPAKSAKSRRKFQIFAVFAPLRESAIRFWEFWDYRISSFRSYGTLDSILFLHESL